MESSGCGASKSPNETMSLEKQITLRWKRITSFVIWFCSFSVGLAYSFLSPALVELKNKYNTTIDQISDVFTVILIAYLVAALISGVLFNYLNRQLMMVGYLMLVAGGVIAAPFCPTMLSFFVVGGIIGFGYGGVDTSQIVWMLEMWEGEAGLYVQSQYAFFALGITTAPLLLKPFLLEEAKNSTSTTTANTLWPSGIITDDLSTVVPVTSDESRLYIPLSIGGGIMTMAAVCLLLIFFKKKYVPPKQAESPTHSGRDSEAASGDTSNGTSRDWRKIILIALSAITLGCYQGMEIVTVQFIPTFTHYVDLKVSEPDGALILLGFTAAFTVGRFMGIGIVVFKVVPAKILLGNLFFTVSGLIIWILFANTNLILLWIGALSLGLGFSTVFACIYDHIEKHVKITNMVAAVMVIAGGLVSAMYPLVIGKAVERTPFILIYTCIFSVTICTMSFGILYYLTIIKNLSAKTSALTNA